MGDTNAAQTRGRQSFLRIAALTLTAIVLLAPVYVNRAHADATQTAQPPQMQMEIFPIDDTTIKLTIYGIGETLTYMRKNAENYQCIFRYNIRFSGARDIDIKGKIVYYHYPNKTVEVMKKVVTKMECKNITYDVKHPMVETNKLSWIVKFPAWMNYSTEKLKNVDFKIYNAYDTRKFVTHSFAPADIVTKTFLRTNLKPSGELRIDVPDDRNIRIYITDPDLKSGYKNSVGAKGTLTPVWYTKVVCNSYQWIDVRIDGSDGQTMDQMAVRAGEFHLNEHDTNKYHAKSAEVTTASYKIEGDTIIIDYEAPANFPRGLNYVKWIEVDMQNGVIKNKYKIQ
ncbi:MAG: hypothetical protein RR224_10280 [Clostridia bacterium]